MELNQSESEHEVLSQRIIQAGVSEPSDPDDSELLSEARYKIMLKNHKNAV